MRLIADVLPNAEGVKRLMIHETEGGVYLFGFNRVADGGCKWDEWYETVADAKEAAEAAYQLVAEAWAQIADPCEHCQQDWIQPVRVKGRGNDRPEWGRLERLIDNQWVEFDPEKEA
jgi:biofilm protein TabA